MTLTDFLAADDVSGAAAYVLAHPVSLALSKPMVRHLFSIAFEDEQPFEADREFLTSLHQIVTEISCQST